ncbi:hypothetical protein [Ramlibacter sp. PS4R-6]|uniref:hypothetical protein n=1 Tax=Ramlibacter sp. PS4R-6 TaxID=3133438 RepID=UPI0030A66EFB
MTGFDQFFKHPPIPARFTTALKIFCGLAMACPSLAIAQHEMGPGGSICYLSREYRAGVRDRVLVQSSKGSAHVQFQMTYCNFEMSPDCANARSEELDVTGSAAGNVIRAKAAGGTCAVTLRFLNSKQRLLVTQETSCPQLKYWGPHGVYVPEKLNAGEQSACSQ